MVWDGYDRGKHKMAVMVNSAKNYPILLDVQLYWRLYGIEIYSIFCFI